MTKAGKLALQLIVVVVVSILLTIIIALQYQKPFQFNVFFTIFCFSLTTCILIRLWEERIHQSYEYNSERTIKIGLDIHGMINHDPTFFSELSRTLLCAGHEIHIMTGSHITDEVVNELKSHGMQWTKLYSIADYYKNKPGVKMTYDAKGRPWISDELWNMAKADYAREHMLDLTLDDSQEYEQYFSTSIGICRIENKANVPKKEKAKRPISDSNNKKMEA